LDTWVCSLVSNAFSPWLDPISRLKKLFIHFVTLEKNQTSCS
jgi:hypothetical protein